MDEDCDMVATNRLDSIRALSTNVNTPSNTEYGGVNENGAPFGFCAVSTVRNCPMYENDFPLLLTLFSESIC